MACSVRVLTMQEYPLWDSLLATSPQRSIFAERWWMQIVTGGDVQLLGCFDGDRLVAGLPIWPCTTCGIKRLRQPPLTPYWGPLLAPLEGKYVTRMSTELEILRAFAQALLPWRDVTIAYHPSLGNWLPFYWNGYTQMTRYTFRIEEMAQNLPSQKALHRSIRCALNRAEANELILEEQVDPMLIAEMSRQSMARQDLHSSDEIRSFWPELSEAARKRNCYYNVIARDRQGNVHAGYAMLWDDRYAYDLYGGGVPAYRELGGGTLAMYRLLSTAATVAPAFDFEGSMIESIGRFFRQFGGELTPYLFLTRTTSFRLNSARAIKHWLQRERQPKSPVPSSSSMQEEALRIPVAG